MFHWNASLDEQVTERTLGANHLPAAHGKEFRGGHLTPQDAVVICRAILIVDCRLTRHSRGFERNKLTGWPRQVKTNQTLQPVWRGYIGGVHVV